ncbi:hypothetical protein [Klebsiella pneumoniae]|uniref:hypothetical protein n=2 Tax=Klebsiella pneumoniae TaxID=573 RepID=UPI002ED27787|nr:hypothetical protein [Klebsiella pneumoniae]
MRSFFLILLALSVGAGLGHFGPDLVMAANKTELTVPAPDPDVKFVKPPRPGQSFGCDPLASADVFDDRFDHKATVWTKYEASKVAIQVSDDGKRLSVMKAMDVSTGSTQPEDFKISSNGNSYLLAEEQLTLGVALLIFDVRTMKMVWSFNGQGMLGMKGETVLFQCH